MTYAEIFDYREDTSLKTLTILAFMTRILGGGDYAYTGTLGVANTELEYNAITWTDGRTKPSWSDVSTLWYPAWIAEYNSQSITNGKYKELKALYIDTKSAASHSHAMSDSTGLLAALDAKVNSLDGTGLAIKTYAGSTNSSGELIVHITDTGFSGGAALFSSYKAIGVTGFDASGVAISAPHPFAVAWSNSNKTLTVKATKGTSTGILIGGTVVSEAFVGASVPLEITVIGIKV